MWSVIKDPLRKVVNAAGYTLVPLAPEKLSPFAGEKPAASSAIDIAVSPTPDKSAAYDTNAAVPIAPVEPDRPRAGHSARIDFGQGIPVDQAVPTGDRFAEVEALMAKITPWSGNVPAGYVADFLGVLTDSRFLWNRTGPFEAHFAKTELPTVATWGEGWFEIADWFYSASEASGEYVAISLGASYGPQLVGAWKTLQAINPMPARLAAVEPVPENCAWARQHMAVNGIDPDEHWIIQAAVGVDNEPNLFPVGAPGTGLTASVQTNSIEARRDYAELFARSGQCERILRNILVYNSTGATHALQFGYNAEVKLVSAVTLRDVLTPFKRVDLLEVDMQQAEAHIIPPFMDLLNRKVRRVHIGTHGRAVHAGLRGLFLKAGWEFVFDYDPETRHITERGPLEIGDGILSARNPAV
jgi:FkbM family methyltransferase